MKSPSPSVTTWDNTAQVDWLFLDLNSYFASCEQQLNPALRGRPVAVVPMLADTTCCIAASYEAKTFGIKTGTLVREAKQRCPEITLIPAQHQKYIRFHHQVVEVVESCHPVHSVLSIDEMACHLGGSDRQLKKARQLALEIKQRIYRQVGTELRCSIGLAPNRFLAKVASDMQKPDGLTALLKEELPQSLFSLKPIDFPGIGPRMERRLHEKGIFTTSQLCQLSLHEMRAIWNGVTGEQFYRQLRGEDWEPSLHDRKSISHQHVLPPSLRTGEKAKVVLKKLLLKGATRLRKEGFFTGKLTVQVKFLPRQYFETELVFRETQNSFFLIQSLNQCLTHLPKGAPLKVGITFSRLVSAEKHQFSFFEEEEKIALNEAMDQINEKYGKHALSFGPIHELDHSLGTPIAFNHIPEME